MSAWNFLNLLHIWYGSHLISIKSDWSIKFAIDDHNFSNAMFSFMILLFWLNDRFFLPPGIGKIITMISLELSELEMVFCEVWEMLFNDISLLLLLLLLMLLFTFVIALNVRIMKVKKLKLLKPKLPMLLSTWPDEHPVPEFLFILSSFSEECSTCWPWICLIAYNVWFRLWCSWIWRSCKMFEESTEIYD